MFIYVFSIWLPFLFLFWFVRMFFKYIWRSKSHLVKNNDFNIFLFLVICVFIPLYIAGSHSIFGLPSPNDIIFNMNFENTH